MIKRTLTRGWIGLTALLAPGLAVAQEATGGADASRWIFWAIFAAAVVAVVVAFVARRARRGPHGPQSPTPRAP